jgi:hypothetical protein
VALSHSPSIVTNGLVLCLDAANRKGYDKFENLTPYSNEHTNSYWASPPNGGVNNLPTITLEGSNSLGNYYRWTKTSSPWITGFFGSHFPDILSGSVTISFNIKWGGGITNLRWYGYNNVTGTCTNQIDINSSSGVDIGDGWRKVTMTFTATNSTNRWFIEITGTGYWLMQNIQSELGSTATDYYATTSTAKNRGTILSDLSGNGNTGTLTNGVGYGNSNNGSFVFDGANDYVPTSTLSNQFLTTGFTVSVWLYYIPTTANDNLISWGGGAFNGTAYSWEIRLRGNNGNIEFSPGIGPGGTGIPNRLQYISPSGWGLRIMCIDVTFVANGVATLYENGVSRATRDYTGIGVSSQTRAIDVGRGSDTYFPGNIYSVKVYNRALTASEIRQNYNATKGRYGL